MALHKGYRAWEHMVEKDKPILKSPQQHYIWVPGENVSSFKSTGDPKGDKERFESVREGFYSRKYIPDLISEGYYTPGKAERIAGEVLHYGKVVESGPGAAPGTAGFRSEKAEIVGLFEDPSVKCDICNSKPAEVRLESDSGSSFVCMSCYHKIKEKTKKKLKEESWPELRKKIAHHYDVPLTELPSDVLKVKVRGY